MNTKDQKNAKLQLPELANPINSNVKNESFNSTSPCNLGAFIGYYQD